ncbi:MAG TPA: glycosyltransferase family 4 protein [Phycisphaerae bacterium]|nr:glycosyltransferase family 4 protein [Phycisphaerae bacterium]
MSSFHKHKPAVRRRVALLAVHHVAIGDQRYHGGAEKYIRLTIRALLDAGAAVHVGYSGTSIYDDLLAGGSAARLTVEQTGWINDVLAGDARLSPKTIAARRRWLRRTGADTVFAVQQASGGAFAASLIAAKLLGLRVVSSIRQLPEPLPAPTEKRWLGFIPSPQLWRRRLLWRRGVPALCCDAIIFNSRRVAEAYFREYRFPRARCRIIPNGELPRPTDKAALSVPPCNIATVGRVTHAKGCDALLEAFALVSARHPDARLTYYGDGPQIGDLQARSRALGLAGRIAFPGYESDHEKVYPQIDIYVQASRRESMSNSVIEAMARGIPCVVTNVGGLPETVGEGECGFVVPPDEPRACAEAICRLLGDREVFARLGDAAIERVRRHFNLEHVTRQTVETILGDYF